ncbi:MAG: hypothetical protein Q8R01_13460 [Ramlibacter sp.]|nr:hypothetical protein [Ramlibacter sp.]
MDLKDFVAASLTQIAEGVAQSAPAISALGGAVSPAFSPSTAPGEFLGEARDGSNAPVYGVAFDVAVIVGSAGSAEGGGKLQVASFLSFGGKVGTAEREETTSRIKFVVPLRLPTDPDSVKGALDAEAKAQAAFNRPLPPPRRGTY